MPHKVHTTTPFQKSRMIVMAREGRFARRLGANLEYLGVNRQTHATTLGVEEMKIDGAPVHAASIATAAPLSDSNALEWLAATVSASKALPAFRPRSSGGF